MDDTNVKRGIDLQNRFWESSLAKKFRERFWRSNPINKITFLGIISVFLINLFIISSVFKKDLTPSFASSFFMMFAANTAKNLGIASVSQFFLILSTISLFFSPVTFYLFTRRMAGRHELTAFLATLLFIIPNPVTGGKPPLITAILAGDGAHIIIFSFLPLFLLYFRSFIDTGLYYWGLFSAIGTCLIALISPFGLFNLFIFMLIITFSEGFMGGFRIKFARLLFVIVSAFGLSFFWYNPERIDNILKLESFNRALSYFWGKFPILIPAIPIIGSLSFLIFDRRRRLRPVFVGIFLFVSYFFLTTISISINSSGIFISQRYNPEFALSKTFLFGLSLGFIFDFLVFKFKDYREKKNRKMMTWTFLSIAGIIAVVVITFIFSIGNIGRIIGDIQGSRVYSLASLGVGSIGRGGFFKDPSSILSILVSVMTLIMLLYLVKFFPWATLSKSKK